MKKYIFILLITIAFGCNTKQSENEKNSFPVLTGKYVGQNVPGLTPEIFAPNIVSTGMSEINACFSPDFTEFFYTNILPNRKMVIISMSYINGKWSEPEVANFSGKYSDADPFITKDGKWLYFVSKRPENSTKNEKSDWDIWRMQKTDGKWLHPERLGNEINSQSDDIYPTLSDNGTLYFSSGRDGKNNRDIFYSTFTGDKFNSSIKLNDTINGHWEGDLFISPKEDFLIFKSYGRVEGSGLFITFKTNNHWSIPIRMGEEINMTGNELCPIISPDGKYFFFSSSNTIEKTDTSDILTYQKIKEDFITSFKNPQMGKTDIYWVKSEIIEKYRNKSR